MSDSAWSWTAVLQPGVGEASVEVLEPQTNLSTSPSGPSLGQVDRSKRDVAIPQGSRRKVYTREFIIQNMVNWGEHSAIMHDGNQTVEQAELLAWHDLNLDSVFSQVGIEIEGS